MTTAPASDPRVLRTQRRVMEAVADLLVEEGFGRITVDAIAERSGVARSTVYRNWPNRAEMLADAFGLVCDIGPVPDHGSLVEDFRWKARHLVRGLNEQRWGKVLPSLIGAAAHDEDLGRALTAFAASRREEAEALVDRARARGEVPADAPVGQAVERFVAAFFLRHLMTHDPLDDDFVESQLATLLSDLTRPAPTPEKSP